jgi:uncharacterized protein YndB with AHSA1/START domain
MSRRTVVVSRRVDAPVEVVWSLVAEARRWKEWGAFTVAELEREGDPAPDGVGAVRRFGFPMYASREEVVAFEPPTHLGYVMLQGLPVPGYRSDVTLTAVDGGGTELRWASSFDARPWDAWLWAAVLDGLLHDFTRRVARAATSGSRGPRG